MAQYDVIVIGGGPAGENAAARAARSELSVAIIEKELLGGECSYWACMPSKALLRPGEALAAARRVPGVASAITGDLDVEAALDRRNSLSANWDDAGQVAWAEGEGLEIIRGHGRLAGPRRVTVTHDDGSETTLTATVGVVVATGTAAAWPPIDGLKDAGVWDNRQATTAADVPESLTIVGGGVVGCELAQAWKSLGAQRVTIVEMADRLIAREEPFASAALREALEQIGVAVMTSVRVVSVRREPGRGVVTTLADGTELDSTELLVAVGRRPLTSDIGLETIGLQSGGYLEVDDQMRVTAVDDAWLYAVGDVNGRALLTHAGKYQARVAGDHIGGSEVAAWADIAATPRVIFTDPQVAAVGLTEDDARARYEQVTAVDYDLGRVAGSSTMGRGIRGTCRLVVDDERQVVVGATFVGPAVAELLHAATIAIVAEVPLSTLWHAIPAFPTQSEIWLRLLETYGL